MGAATNDKTNTTGSDETPADGGGSVGRSHPPTVTGSVIYGWFHNPCSMRVHLDLFGDRSRRVKAGPVGRYLMERGIRHEVRVFDEIRERYPDDWAEVPADPDAVDRQADFARRAERTRKLMREGKRFIFHAIFEQTIDADDVDLPAWSGPAATLRFRGETDILERIDVPTPEFGDHGYIVGDVKSSRTSKLSQKLQVTFYSWLLGHVQRALPRTGYVVTGAGTREDFEIDETIWSLRHFIEEEVYELTCKDDVFYHLAPACEGCAWRAVCREQAEEEDDVSLVPSCRRYEKRTLEQNGIHSREQLVAASDDELRGLGRSFGNRLDGFRDLKRYAYAAEVGRPIMRQAPRSRATSRGGAPDFFRHVGPFLLVTSIVDHYDGRDIAAAAMMVRRPDLVNDGNEDGFRPQDVRFFFDRDGRDLLAHDLAAETEESDRLLAARREKTMVVLAEAGLPWRLADAASRAEATDGKNGARMERLVSDAVSLSRELDQTLFLPVPSRDVHATATALTQRRDIPYARRGLTDATLFSDVVPFLGNNEDATTALRLWNATLDDFGIAAGSIMASTSKDATSKDTNSNHPPSSDDGRTLAVREWRSGGDVSWQVFLRAALLEDLRASGVLLNFLLGMTS